MSFYHFYSHVAMFHLSSTVAMWSITRIAQSYGVALCLKIVHNTIRSPLNYE